MRWLRAFWDWEVEPDWIKGHTSPYPYPNIYMGRMIVVMTVVLGVSVLLVFLVQFLD